MPVRKRTTLGVALGVCLALVGACTGARLPAQTVSAGAGRHTTTSEGDANNASRPSATTDSGDPLAGGSGATVPGAPGAKAGPRGAAGTGGTPTSPPAQATLFTPKEDTVGITKTSINLCAHAALTYAAAFDTSPDDLNVYWSAINDAGGIYGRKINVTYEDDQYKSDEAVTAATKCKGKGIFFLIGGIGFDQIPAVRNWAETNHMLYLHHTATVQGTSGQHYSFTGLPSTEKMGEVFGELVASRYKDKKIGIIKRHSVNWEPGVTAFKAVAKKYGVNIVGEKEVENGQGNYSQEIRDLQKSGADVIWIWENAFASIQVVKQAKAQSYNPQFLLFPFNLTSQALLQDALNPKLVGVAMFPAYSYRDYTGPFASYADDMKEFEAQYAKYRPNARLGGVAGDLLFLNWTGQKGLALLLKQCGPDCTRNRLVDVLTSFKATRPFSSSCDVDFARPGFARMGGFSVNIMETYQSAIEDPVNWRNTNACVEHLL